MTQALPSETRPDVRAEIVEAAAHLLRTNGAHAVTTRAVAHAAGVQPPTIYRLFGDKDGLIDAVAEHVMAAYVADKLFSAADADGDPVEELRVAWQLHVQFGLANAELYGLLNAPGRLGRSPATMAGIEVLRMRVRRIAAAGLLRVDEQRAVDMIHAAGTGTVLALLSTPESERDPGLPAAVFDALAAAVLATEPAIGDTTVGTLVVTFLTVVPELPALTVAERALLGEWIARSLAHLRQDPAR